MLLLCKELAVVHPYYSHQLLLYGAEHMFSRKHTPSTDRRDEIMLAIIALLIPLATLPAMLGL